MLPAASYVTVQASGSTGGILTPGQLQNAISDELSGAGLLVKAIKVDAPTFAGVLVGFLYWPYSITMTVQTRSIFADEGSVAGLVRGAIEDQAGQAPDAVTYQQTRDTGIKATDGGGFVDPFAWIKDLFAGVQGDVQLIIVALVVLVGLIVFGPQTGAIARAVGGGRG